jgi:hypothetical protein
LFCLARHKLVRYVRMYCSTGNWQWVMDSWLLLFRCDLYISLRVWHVIHIISKTNTLQSQKHRWWPLWS